MYLFSKLSVFQIITAHVFYFNPFGKSLLKSKERINGSLPLNYLVEHRQHNVIKRQSKMVTMCITIISNQNQNTHFVNGFFFSGSSSAYQRKSQTNYKILTCKSDMLHFFAVKTKRSEFTDHSIQKLTQVYKIGRNIVLKLVIHCHN